MTKPGWQVPESMHGIPLPPGWEIREDLDFVYALRGDAVLFFGLKSMSRERLAETIAECVRKRR